ncbi:MAG: carbohydrate-binding domain-containing protein [Firmicutes bacterium]|nr:carbohydrate-binding domain-containing protein [Bacillota bacterium]
MLVLSLVIVLGACGSKANTTNETNNAGSTAPTDEATSEVANEEETNADDAATTTNAEESAAEETAESGSESSSSSVTVPDGFTERDFDIGYSDYETITLSGGTASTDASGASVSGSTVTINAAGNYLLTGELNGQIVVDVPGTEDKVQLILDNATITNDTSASIYVLNADKVFVTTTEGSVNKISTTGAFIQTDENAVDGAIFSKDDIVFNGEGALNVTSVQGHAIVSKDDLKITSGTYELTSAEKALSANDLIGIAGGDITIVAGDDGLNSDLDVNIYDGTININATDDGVHAEATLTVDGGEITIVAAEGLEATVVTVNDGSIDIAASDDGINAAQKVTDYTPALEINGGEITVTMAAGDTDALDSNGYLYINGGVVNISAQFPFDYDLGGAINGGEVYVNGQQVTELYNAMMGGPGGWGGGQMPGGQGGGGRP